MECPNAGPSLELLEVISSGLGWAELVSPDSPCRREGPVEGTATLPEVMPWVWAHSSRDWAPAVYSQHLSL